MSFLSAASFATTNNLVLAILFLFAFSLYTIRHGWNEIKNLQPILTDKNNTCPVSSSGDWQNVTHPQYKYWVYSAYSFEDRQVVIIGSPFPFTDDELDEEHRVKCAFHYPKETDQGMDCYDNATGIKTEAELKRMEVFNPKWAATLIHCPLPNDTAEHTDNPPPTFVSILLANQTESPVRLPIQYRHLNESYPRPYKFSTCVLPLYDYDDMFHFLEWLEFYKMMGVEHFTFYNSSIGPETSCVMRNIEKYYKKSITVHVHPWRDGFDEENGSNTKFRTDRTELSAGVNECMYRHKGVSKFVVFVDVDEFIVPREGIPDYPHLIDILQLNQGDAMGMKAGAFVFQNSFYLKNRDEDPDLAGVCSGLQGNAVEYQVCQQMWTMKFSDGEPVLPWSIRSKYITMPDVVVNAGIHRVLKFKDDTLDNMKVESTFAVSRHYRIGNQTETSDIVRMPLGLGASLAVNVAASLKFFMNFCNLTTIEIFD